MANSAKLSVECTSTDPEEPYQFATSRSSSFSCFPPEDPDDFSPGRTTLQLDQAQRRQSFKLPVKMECCSKQSSPLIISVQFNSNENSKENNKNQPTTEEAESKERTGKNGYLKNLRGEKMLLKVLWKNVIPNLIGLLTYLLVVLIWRDPKITIENVFKGNIYNNWGPECKILNEVVPDWPCPPRKDDAYNKSETENHRVLGSDSSKSTINSDCGATVNSFQPSADMWPYFGVNKASINNSTSQDSSKGTILLTSVPDLSKTSVKSHASADAAKKYVNLRSGFLQDYETAVQKKKFPLNKTHGFSFNSQKQYSQRPVILDACPKKSLNKGFSVKKNVLSLTKSVKKNNCSNKRVISATSTVPVGHGILLDLKSKKQICFKTVVIKHRQSCYQSPSKHQQAKHLIKSCMTQDFTSLSMQGDSACKPAVKSQKGTGSVNIDHGLGIFERPLSCLIQVLTFSTSLLLGFLLSIWVSFCRVRLLPTLKASLACTEIKLRSLIQRLAEKAISVLMGTNPDRLGLIMQCLMYCSGSDIAESVDSGISQPGSLQLLNAEELHDLHLRFRRRPQIRKPQSSVDPNNTSPVGPPHGDANRNDESDDDNSIPWPKADTKDQGPYIPSKTGFAGLGASSNQTVSLKNLSDPTNTWENFDNDSLVYDEELTQNGASQAAHGITKNENGSSTEISTSLPVDQEMGSGSGNETHSNGSNIANDPAGVSFNYGQNIDLDTYTENDHPCPGDDPRLKDDVETVIENDHLCPDVDPRLEDDEMSGFNNDHLCLVDDSLVKDDVAASTDKDHLSQSDDHGLKDDVKTVIENDHQYPVDDPRLKDDVETVIENDHQYPVDDPRLKDDVETVIENDHQYPVDDPRLKDDVETVMENDHQYPVDDPRLKDDVETVIENDHLCPVDDPRLKDDVETVIENDHQYPVDDPRLKDDVETVMENDHQYPVDDPRLKDDVETVIENDHLCPVDDPRLKDDVETVIENDHQYPVDDPRLKDDVETVIENDHQYPVDDPRLKDDVETVIENDHLCPVDDPRLKDDVETVIENDHQYPVDDPRLKDDVKTVIENDHQYPVDDPRLKDDVETVIENDHLCPVDDPRLKDDVETVIENDHLCPADDPRLKGDKMSGFNNDHLCPVDDPNMKDNVKTGKDNDLLSPVDDPRVKGDVETGIDKDHPSPVDDLWMKDDEKSGFNNDHLNPVDDPRLKGGVKTGKDNDPLRPVDDPWLKDDVKTGLENDHLRPVVDTSLKDDDKSSFNNDHLCPADEPRVKGDVETGIDKDHPSPVDDLWMKDDEKSGFNNDHLNPGDDPRLKDDVETGKDNGHQCPDVDPRLKADVKSVSDSDIPVDELWMKNNVETGKDNGHQCPDVDRRLIHLYSPYRNNKDVDVGTTTSVNAVYFVEDFHLDNEPCDVSGEEADSVSEGSNEDSDDSVADVGNFLGPDRDGDQQLPRRPNSGDDVEADAILDSLSEAIVRGAFSSPPGPDLNFTRRGNPVCQENALVRGPVNVSVLLEAVKEKPDNYELLLVGPRRHDERLLQLRQPRRRYIWPHQGMMRGGISDMMNFLLGIVSAQNQTGVLLQCFPHSLGRTVRILTESRRLCVDHQGEISYIEERIDLGYFLEQRRAFEIYISHQDNYPNCLKVYGITKTITQDGQHYVNIIYECRERLENRCITVFVMHKPPGQPAHGQAFQVVKGQKIKTVLALPRLHRMVTYLKQRYPSLTQGYCVRLTLLGCQAMANPSWILNNTCILELVPTL